MGIQIYDQISIARKLSEVKLRHAFLLEFGLKQVQIAPTLQNLACMNVYPMGSQIYNQVSILRSTSKVKLDCTILLGFGLKELKIIMNIVKVGMHIYHPNAHQKK